MTFMASLPLKIKKGTCPVFMQATRRHTTESVGMRSQKYINEVVVGTFILQDVAREVH